MPTLARTQVTHRSRCSIASRPSGSRLLGGPTPASTTSRCSTAGDPRLYLVEPDAAPPPYWGSPRIGGAPTRPGFELLDRANTLLRRADAIAAIAQLDDTLLRIGGRLIFLSSNEASPVAGPARPAWAHRARDDVVAAVWPDGPPSDPRALDNPLKTLRKRLAGTRSRSTSCGTGLAHRLRGDRLRHWSRATSAARDQPAHRGSVGSKTSGRRVVGRVLEPVELGPQTLAGRRAPRPAAFGRRPRRGVPRDSWCRGRAPAGRAPRRSRRRRGSLAQRDRGPVRRRARRPRARVSAGRPGRRGPSRERAHRVVPRQSEPPHREHEQEALGPVAVLDGSGRQAAVDMAHDGDRDLRAERLDPLVAPNDDIASSGGLHCTVPLTPAALACLARPGTVRWERDEPSAGAAAIVPARHSWSSGRGR